MNEPEIYHSPGRQRPRLLPGATLSGDYRIDCVERGNLQAIEVSVLWHSEGKGDEDLAVHEFWRKDADGAEAGRSPAARPLQHDAAAKPVEL